MQGFLNCILGRHSYSAPTLCLFSLLFNFTCSADTFINSVRRSATYEEASYAVNVGCAGVLLDKYTGMTAGHCILNPTGFTFTGATFHIGKILEQKNQGLDYQIFTISWDNFSDAFDVSYPEMIATDQDLMLGTDDNATKLMMVSIFYNGDQVYSEGFSKSFSEAQKRLFVNIDGIPGDSGSPVFLHDEPTILAGILVGGPHDDIKDPKFWNNDREDSKAWNYVVPAWEIYLASPALQKIFQ